ncbi:MAG: YihY/virulence factor BrkB family protein [Sphingomonadaceae bacterium]|nr:YihY/virulence factor BrkB family protein [Sphingomonadaceae bacterium]
MPDKVWAQPPQREVRSLSPEARKREAKGLRGRVARHVGPGTRVFQVARRVLVGTYNDGFIHAGNLAYMSLLAMFPFFVLGSAIFSAFGEEAERQAMVLTVVSTLPPMVAKVLEPVALDIIDLRSGWLLWAGAAVGLWTTGSLVETIRDILRRAYGTPATYAFWKARLLSTGFILLSVAMLLLFLLAQVALGAAQQVIATSLPWLDDALTEISLGRIAAGLGLFLPLYLLFLLLTPQEYRGRRYPKWPGAVVVTLWWLAVTAALPPAIRTFFTYNLTYGSLAGIMITLFFFWLVGLGIVIGAELNAALADPTDENGEGSDTDKPVEEEAAA